MPLISAEQVSDEGRHVTIEGGQRGGGEFGGGGGGFESHIGGGCVGGRGVPGGQSGDGDGGDHGSGGVEGGGEVGGMNGGGGGYGANGSLTERHAGPPPPHVRGHASLTAACSLQSSGVIWAQLAGAPLPAAASPCAPLPPLRTRPVAAPATSVQASSQESQVTGHSRRTKSKVAHAHLSAVQLE